MMDARALVKSLGGMWTGSYGLVRCPCHDDRKPSCKIKDDPRKSDGIDVVCFAGCGWRDIKAALSKEGLIADTSINTCSQNPIPLPRRTEADDADAKSRVEYAGKLWRQSVALEDTLGWRYFTERRELHIGLLGDLSHALRWHQGICAVIALMTDPTSNEPCGIHRTFLNPDGTKRERKMIGRQGVVRLSPDEDVTQGFGICEGVEDGLAVLLSGWSPVWAATSAGAIARFPVLPGIESLTIFADTDEVGLNAAEACASRWDAAGREIAIREPE
ncbi:MAG: toprim domain-containing protein [Terriglobales bacterium]